MATWKRTSSAGGLPIGLIQSYLLNYSPTTIITNNFRYPLFAVLHRSYSYQKNASNDSHNAGAAKLSDSGIIINLQIGWIFTKNNSFKVRKECILNI